MALADRLKTYAPATTRVRCLVCAYLDTLDDMDQCVLIDTLANITIPGSWIHEQIADFGFTGSANTVRRHRRSKECSEYEPKRQAKRGTATRR